MALKNMSLVEQHAEGKLLCDDLAPIASIFGKDAAVAALRERVRKNQDRIEGIQLKQGVLSAKIIQYTDQMLVQDSDNDLFIGAVDDMGQAAIKLAQDSALAEALVGALGKVFTTSRAQLIAGSYAGMGAEADRIERVLEAADREALGKVSVDGYSLMDALEHWFIGCRALTAMSQQRDQLTAQQDTSATSASEVVDARNQWIRSVNAMVAAVEASEDIAEEDKAIALASLRATEGRADLRAAERRRLTVI